MKLGGLWFSLDKIKKLLLKGMSENFCWVDLSLGRLVVIPLGLIKTSIWILIER